MLSSIDTVYYFIHPIYSANVASDVRNMTQVNDAIDMYLGRANERAKAEVKAQTEDGFMPFNEE